MEPRCDLLIVDQTRRVLLWGGDGNPTSLCLLVSHDLPIRGKPPAEVGGPPGSNSGKRPVYGANPCLPCCIDQSTHLLVAGHDGTIIFQTVIDDHDGPALVFGRLELHVVVSRKSSSQSIGLRLGKRQFLPASRIRRREIVFLLRHGAGSRVTVGWLLSWGIP